MRSSVRYVYEVYIIPIVNLEHRTSRKVDTYVQINDIWCL